MIGESSGVSTLLNSERIYREQQAESQQRVPGDAEETTVTSVSDEVTFSAEAVALAQRVPAASENDEQGRVEPEGRQQDQAEERQELFLDIRV